MLLPSWRLLITGVADMPRTYRPELRSPAWQMSNCTSSRRLGDVFVPLFGVMNLVHDNEINRLTHSTRARTRTWAESGC